MSLECPYCDSDIDDPDDCYDPCVDYEHECPHCGKNFVFQVEYTRDYRANKAACLNGGEHEYREQKRYGSGEPEVFRSCKNCGHKGSNVI